MASADIGDLGPKDGTAAIYDWKLYYNIPSLALWAVLILAIVLIKGNRNPRALLILVPLLIVNLFWTIFKKAIGFPSEPAQMFGMVFYSLTVGITILWLLAHKLCNRNRFVTFLRALAIMAVVGLAGVVSYGMTEFSSQTMAIIILLAVLALTTLCGFALAAWCCRKRYGSVRFVLWLGLCIVVLCVATMLGFYSIVFIVSRPPVSVFTVLLQVSIAALVVGGCLYVIVFPYMILALRSPFFRERFYACLRLKSMPIASGPVADADRHSGQNPGPEVTENRVSD